MKKNLFLLVFAVVMALLATSCGKKDQTLRVIPKNAAVVVKMNAAQLLEKSEVAKLKEVQDELKKIDDPVMAEVVKQLQENPMSAGVDITRPVVVAVTDVNKGGFVVAATMKSKDDFTKLLEKVKTSKNGGNMEIKTGDVCTATTGKDGKMAYNDELLVVSNVQDPATLIAQKEEDSFMAVKNTEDFMACGTDMAVFLSYEGLMARMASMPGMDMMAKSANAIAKDLAIFVSMSFEDGQAVCNSKMYGNEQYMTMLKNGMQDAKGKFLADMPANSFLVVQTGVNDYSQMLQMLDKSTIDQLNQAAGGDVAKLVASLHGDLALGVAPNGGFNNVPFFVIEAECKDSALWDAVKGFLPKIGAEPSADGFTIPMGDYDIKVTFKDNVLKVAPGEGTVKGGFDKSPLAAQIANGGVLDIETVLKDPTVAQDEESACFTFLKNVVFATSNDGSSTVTLTTAKGRNVLAQVIEAFVKVREVEKKKYAQWEQEMASYDVTDSEDVADDSEEW